ncbi:MAG TPA: hypothetical protein VFP84_00680 [Kofleriaceae bacterium]|nr:hypothetical protein [Kofleriaceae bacterium]
MYRVAIASAVVLASATGAHADPESFNPDPIDLSVLDRAVAPTGRALEIALGGGYTQGVGGAGAASPLEDTTGPGGNVEVQVGMRITPRLAVGVYGTLARYRHGELLADGNQAYGATGGVQAAWHVRPSRSVDPWLSLGAGWRGLWLRQHGQPQVTAYGVELARLQVGVDYRISPALAVAPVVGASASVFVAQDTAKTDSFTAVRDDRLNLYVFGGLLGRFDIGRFAHH